KVRDEGVAGAAAEVQQQGQAQHIQQQVDEKLGLAWCAVPQAQIQHAVQQGQQDKNTDERLVVQAQREAEIRIQERRHLARKYDQADDEQALQVQVQGCGGKSGFH